jgi:hypothetical protein
VFYIQMKFGSRNGIKKKMNRKCWASFQLISLQKPLLCTIRPEAEAGDRLSFACCPVLLFFCSLVERRCCRVVLYVGVNGAAVECDGGVMAERCAFGCTARRGVSGITRPYCGVFGVLEA